MADFLVLRFCDDNGNWSVPRKFDISSGKNPVIKLPSSGLFRSRQIEIVVEAPVQVVVTGMEIEVTDLGN
jgi:hypothetical protein